MPMRSKHGAGGQRHGVISAQPAGRFFHAFLRFSLLAGDLGAVSVAMIRWTSYTPAFRCSRRPYHYIATTGRKAQLSSIARGSHTGRACPGRAIEAQDAGDEFADGDPQMAPESPLQAGVILRAAEQVAHQLPEHRAAPQELNHARRNRAAKERSAIETPHDARRQL